MKTLQWYRDDGPLIETLSPALSPLPLAPVVATLLGVAGLFAGLLVDGATTGAPTIAGATVFVVLAGIGAARLPDPRSAWMISPLLRAGEYGFIAWLGWRAGTAALSAVYGLLAAVAFHHYDIVYRLRHQRVELPAWVGRVGLGWEGRCVVMLAAAVAGVVAPVAAVLGVWCAVIFVTESVASWVRIARDTQRTVAVASHDDEE